MIIKYDGLINKVGAELDNKVLRGKLIASNIANVDTPGYKSKDVKFERVIQQEMGELNMKMTHHKHLNDGVTSGLIRNEVVDDPTPGRPDGNNVNVDDQMLKMSKNNIQYNTAVTLLSRRMGQIKESLDLAKR